MGTTIASQTRALEISGLVSPSGTARMQDRALRKKTEEEEEEMEKRKVQHRREEIEKGNVPAILHFP